MSSGARMGSSARRRRRRKRLIKALIAWAVCLLLVALVAAGTFRLITSLASSKKRGFREEGIRKMADRDYQGAIASFDQALESSGKKDHAFNSDVLRYRAEAELQLADYGAAIHTYDLLIEADEGSAVSYQYLKAVCLAGSGEEDQAVFVYQEAFAADQAEGYSPGQEEALIAAGSACVDAGKYEQAMSLYEEAVRKGITHGQIYNQMGLCQMAGEDYKGALDSFNKGFEIIGTQYHAGTGAPLSQVAAAVTRENGKDWALLQELAYNRAAACEYLQQYEDALEQFMEYIDVFGEDENARHEIDFLSTR